MPLSTRELFLILRARDEASRTLRGFAGNLRGLSAAQQQAIQRQTALGSALVGTGVAIAAVGAVGVKFFYDSTKAAIDYQNQVALTFTQVDKGKASLQQLNQIGKSVAQDIGAPFDQMQKTLYDIFSSMDVNGRESAILLRAFAKSAVAGQVDIQTAGRATIAIMNAFNIPVSKVNSIMDFQFQLVRKGVGTYSEFATTIGRAIPSAVRAGQTYQVLGGMLAYLTRNGLSAAMASASTARALDAISNPKTVDRLEALGVKVKGLHGEFLPLTDIVSQLQQKLSKLTGPQRSKALQDLFKGSGGTIQARRFFDLVTKSGKEVQDFTRLTKDMQNSAGAAGTAYAIMANTIATKTQLLKNRWQILRVEIGEALLPVFAAIIGWLGKFIGAWNKLNPHLKRVITYVGLIVSGLLIVIGVVMAVVGSFLLFTAAAAAAGIGLGTIAIAVGVAAAVLAAIVVAVILAIKYWKQIKKVFQEVVTVVSNAVVPVFKGFVDWFQNSFMPAVGKVVDYLLARWKEFAGWFSTNIMPIVRSVVDFFISKWHEFTDWWNQVWPSVRAVLEIAWAGIVTIIVVAWRIISNASATGWKLIQGIWNVGIDAIKLAWKIFGDGLVLALRGVWEVIKGVIGGAIQIIEGIFQVFFSLITLNWSGVWAGLQKIFAGFWSIVQGIAKGAYFAALAALSVFKAAFMLVWDATWNAAKTSFGNFAGVVIQMAKFIIGIMFAFAGTILGLASRAFGWVPIVGPQLKAANDKFQSFKTDVLGAMTDAANKMYGLGVAIPTGVANGITAATWKAIQAADKLGQTVQKRVAANLQIASPSKVMVGFGRMVSLGLAYGIGDYMSHVEKAAMKMVNTVAQPMQAGALSGASQTGPVDYWRGKGGSASVSQNITINTQEIDPRKHAADLGWELARRVG